MSARDWAAEMFGDAVSDIRAKLIDEAFFGRRVPEKSEPGDLGWFHKLDSNGVGARFDGPEPEQKSNLHEAYLGIDR